MVTRHSPSPFPVDGVRQRPVVVEHDVTALHPSHRTGGGTIPRSSRSAVSGLERHVRRAPRGRVSNPRIGDPLTVIASSGSEGCLLMAIVPGFEPRPGGADQTKIDRRPSAFICVLWFREARRARRNRPGAFRKNGRFGCTCRSSDIVVDREVGDGNNPVAGQGVDDELSMASDGARRRGAVCHPLVTQRQRTGWDPVLRRSASTWW